MVDNRAASAKKIVVVLSIALLFFTIPHTLEDFATGEPAEANVPAPLIALVVSIVLALQAIGLYRLGKAKRSGFGIHIGIGIFWPLASAVAQLPSILSESTYRSGFISVFYVVAIIAVGLALAIISIIALTSHNREG